VLAETAIPDAAREILSKNLIEHAGKIGGQDLRAQVQNMIDAGDSPYPNLWAWHVVGKVDPLAMETVTQQTRDDYRDSIIDTQSAEPIVQTVHAAPEILHAVLDKSFNFGLSFLRGLVQIVNPLYQQETTSLQDHLEPYTQD